MTYRFASLLLLLAASCGCRACSDCYDYSSPVSYSPAALQSRRAGSTFAATKASEMAESAPTKIELTSYTLDRAPQRPIVTAAPVVAQPSETPTTLTPLPPLFAK